MLGGEGILKAMLSSRVPIVIFGSSVAVLLVVGVLFVCSATIYKFGSYYLKLQLLWAGLGVGLMFIAALSDYRKLQRVWIYLYGMAILLLGLVLVPGIGVEVNGARRWFDLKVLRFQPSEFAKVALIVALAAYCAANRFRIRQSHVALVIPAMMIGLMGGLVFLEPDRGTALLMMVVGGVILWVAGARLGHALLLGLLAFGILGFFLWHDPTIRRRVEAKLTKSDEGAGYQQAQSRLAIASGGIWGKGLHNGRQKMGFVPEIHTDFVASVIGEEKGFVGLTVLVMLYCALVLSGLWIAARAPDTFGLLLSVGAVFLIGIQSFVNLGVVLDILPAKGFPLPFVSYGGSSMLMSSLLVGLVLSVGRISLVESTTMVVPIEKTLSELPEEASVCRAGSVLVLDSARRNPFEP